MSYAINAQGTSWRAINSIEDLLPGERLSESQPNLMTPLPIPSSVLRAKAYREEADPLFFKSQRGEATTEDWLAKVAEIKGRFPE